MRVNNHLFRRRFGARVNVEDSLKQLYEEFVKFQENNIDLLEQ